MPKSLDTLVRDIYSIIETGFEPTETNLDSFASSIKETLRNRLSQPCKNKPVTPFTLRMSNIGTPDRKLWFDAHDPMSRDVEASTAIKFLYGDIIEQLIIYLCKEAGHDVQNEQEEVDIDGLKGHTDFSIDGIPVDAKSVSSYGFKKFSEGTLLRDDPFNYMAQISGYACAKGVDKGAFLACNKESGALALLMINKVDMIDAPTRVKEVRHIVDLPEPPAKKCYDPVPYGKSGNMTLHRNCTYCSHRNQCWSDANGGKGLRKFKYASGIEEFTDVPNPPRVEEVFE